MIIETQAVAPFFKNGFVVSCERTREAVLIDPGDEAPSLLTYADRQQLTITHILLTHAHIDHITGVPDAKRRLHAPVLLHRDDLFLYEGAAEQARMFGLEAVRLPPIDRFYKVDEVISFGDYDVRVHHTPGHCPGGVCLAIVPRGEDSAPHLFVGDTLFAGSIGRTDLPGGDYPTLIRSIREVLFAFGDVALVHSGHGPTTTIGEERRTNPFLT
jgi:glyoxylase-like metal-dependent hydrolase (beta-lactamase superfamily II)